MHEVAGRQPAQLDDEDARAFIERYAPSPDDLPLVAKVADLVHSWLYEHGNGERKEAARG